MSQHCHNVSPQLLLFLIQNQRYGVEYQPIVAVDNLAIFGYEALSRFYDHNAQLIAPDLVYRALHHHPLSLFEVELAQKKLQLEHAPIGAKLFVNLDQDSFFAVESPDALNHADAAVNPFLELFLQHKNNDLVIELIENSEVNDAIMSMKMIQLMASNNIKTALDDIFNQHSMISTSVLQEVNFMKFDRYVVLNKQDPEFLLLIKMMVGYAQASGKKIILEGIETQADLDFAKSINVDYVQGFLFKPQFLRASLSQCQKVSRVAQILG